MALPAATSNLAVPWVAGLVVREYYDDYSNCYAERSLGEMLEQDRAFRLSVAWTPGLSRGESEQLALCAESCYRANASESPAEMIAMVRGRCRA